MNIKANNVCKHSKNIFVKYVYEGVSKRFWTGRIEQELQMVQLSVTRCSCTAIFSVRLVSFATTTFCVASELVFIIIVVVVVVVVVVYFVTDSVRKVLVTPSYSFGVYLSTFVEYNHITA
jgi:hypothetical protein